MAHLWPASTSAILFRALSTPAIPPRPKPRRAGHGALAIRGALHIFERWIIQATEHAAITSTPYCSAAGHQGRVGSSRAATTGMVLVSGRLGGTTCGVCICLMVVGACSGGASRVCAGTLLGGAWAGRAAAS